MSVPATIPVAFITLGCPKNEADTARMRSIFESSAYRVVEDVDEARIVIINTCGFIVEATEESLACIFDVIRDWLPGAADRHLVVAGCLTSRYGDELVSELGEVSLFLGVEDEERLLELLAPLSGVDAASAATRLGTPAPIRRAQAPSEYVKIADGCDRRCSYCTIPAIRGPYRSRPQDEVVDEVRGLVETGAREIVLVAQDTSWYGRDLNDETSLITLIDALCGIEKLAWLRVMYIQPDGMHEALLDCFERNQQVCHYFEMPMQHCSKRLLRDMGRVGDGEEFIALVASIRARLDDAVVRTTLIAGYPSETEQESAALRDFVQQAGFDYTGVFAYSPEEGTGAAQHPEQIDEAVRTERANRLRQVAEETSFKQAERWIGKTLEVLVERQEDDGIWVGRHRGQAPEIDGIVALSASTDAHIEAGMIVSVRIEDTFLYDLEGTLVS